MNIRTYPIHTSFGEANTQALNICKEIIGIDPSAYDAFVFDFKPYGENNPFSNLILINTLRRFRLLNPTTQLACIPKEIDSYLSHIGFYKAIGIPLGKEPGEAIASSTYVPITKIDLFGNKFYQTIEKRAMELAATLQFDVGLQEMLTYCFIETIRNAYEHAKTKNVWVAAQKWPSFHLVEIAIADEGCGISESLGKWFDTDNIGHLRLACLPGITAKSNFDYMEEDDPWRNSGYGLYVMKELALAYEGDLLLCSGGHAIYYYNNGLQAREIVFETNYKGTAIGIRFHTDTRNDFNKVREQIIETGQEKSKQINGAIKTASRSSGGRYHFDDSSLRFH